MTIHNGVKIEKHQGYYSILTIEQNESGVPGVMAESKFALVFKTLKSAKRMADEIAAERTCVILCDRPLLNPLYGHDEPGYVIPDFKWATDA